MRRQRRGGAGNLVARLGQLQVEVKRHLAGLRALLNRLGDRIDGTQLAAELPKGWEGMFELERGSAAADDFIARIEDAFNRGGAVPAGTLYQYISESDGSTSTYQYDGVVFRFAQAGQWRGDASVRQRLEFFASTRRRI